MNKEIFLKTSDGIKIAINLYSKARDSVVIICPGWFMTKDSAIFKKMSEDLFENFDVITMDFRGSGRSRGFYTFSSKEPLDLYCVISYAKKVLEYKNIYLLGFSLGAAVSVICSAKNPDVDKLIAVSVPSDFNKIENRMYSPDAWIPTLFQKFEPLRWFTIRAGNPFLHKIKPIDVVDDISAPTLFVAGDKDPTVHSWHMKALYDKAVCRKVYRLFAKTRHAEDIYHDYPQEFICMCTDWLNY